MSAPLPRTLISDLSKQVGEIVVLEGFVQALRHQGGLKFLVLRDLSGTAQVVIFKGQVDAFAVATHLSIESVARITGLVKEEKQAPGGVEVAAELLEVLSMAEPELPIPVVAEKGGDEVSLPARLDWRWLDLRRKENLQIFQVWTELERGFRDAWEDMGYIQVYAPSFMNTSSETGAEVFEVSYFEKKAYLAQSPQFYKQMAMAAGFEKVFMVGPVFRAEPSFTTRHMTEFTGWDFEVSYITDHADVMDAEEACIVRGFEYIKKNLGLDIEIPTRPFPRMTLAEVKQRLEAQGITGDKADDLSPEEERGIFALVREEMKHDFIFVTDYPASARAFYHMRYDDQPTITKSFDLIYRGLEITTGAQREHRPEILKKQALEKGMSLESLEQYFSFFTYGCPPHGGAGIGPGRIIMMLLGLDSVKEATFLPRDVKRLTP